MNKIKEKIIKFVKDEERLLVYFSTLVFVIITWATILKLMFNDW